MFNEIIIHIKYQTLIVLVAVIYAIDCNAQRDQIDGKNSNQKPSVETYVNEFNKTNTEFFRYEKNYKKESDRLSRELAYSTKEQQDRIKAEKETLELDYTKKFDEYLQKWKNIAKKYEADYNRNHARAVNPNLRVEDLYKKLNELNQQHKDFDDNLRKEYNQLNEQDVNPNNRDQISALKEALLKKRDSEYQNYLYEYGKIRELFTSKKN